MAGPKFTADQREFLKLIVTRLMLKGVTTLEELTVRIEREVHNALGPERAREFSVSQSYVSRIRKSVRNGWGTEEEENREALKAQELAKLDLVEVEAWEGYQRTVGKVNKTTQEGDVVEKENLNTKLTEKKFKPKKTKVQTIEQAGDPRFLKQVTECVMARVEIQGLKAPQEAKLTLDIDDDPKQQLLGRLLKKSSNGAVGVGDPGTDG